MARTIAFFSYTRADDMASDGRLSMIRGMLERELDALFGVPVAVFQGVDDIKAGEDWRTQLEAALSEAQFLIPILTPSFFNSQACVDELMRFRAQEESTGREDLILPVYWLRARQLELRDDQVANFLSTRQFADWRRFSRPQFDRVELADAVRDLADLIEDRFHENGDGFVSWDVESARRVAPESGDAESAISISDLSAGRDVTIGDVTFETAAATRASEKWPDHSSEALRTGEDDPPATPSDVAVEDDEPPPRLIDAAWHPLASGIPPEWASGWGQDEHGVFVEITVGEATQALRWIPPGRFVMGSPEDEAGRWSDEGPQTEITLAQGFWLFETAVTQALYEAVTGENPSRFISPDRPVEQVSWEHAQAFIERLNARLPGVDLRLPSEAEWEYACRAGTTDATYAGPMEILGDNNAPVLDDIAWYGGNSGVGFDLEDGHDSSGWTDKQHDHTKAGTRKVRQKTPNPWGLHDMLGNVFEWCEDVWRGSHEGASPDGSPRPISQQEDGGSNRVIRGGSWSNFAGYCRAAYRYSRRPDDRNYSLGFRPARGQAMSSGRPEGGGAAVLEGRGAAHPESGRGATEGPSSGAGRVAEPRPEQGDGPRRAKNTRWGRGES